MKAWRFYDFGDMRLDEVPTPAPGPGEVLLGVLVVQPSVTEAILAGGRETIGYERVRDRLANAAPVGLFGHEYCAEVVAVGAGLVRERRWNEGFDHVGLGTNGRTLGVIGLGNIGAAVLDMAVPFGFRLLGHDPHTHTRRRAFPPSLERVDLATLLRESDFVCIACPLTDSTRNLIDAERLGLIRPHAYLVNVARGPIVDSYAVAAAVGDGRLAGAALDVFENEPIEPDHPILGLGDKVILTPHALAYTRAAFRSLGVSACESVLALAAGEMPRDPVNPEVIGGEVI